MEKKSNYDEKAQKKYREKTFQIALWYGIKDKNVVDGILQFCEDHNIEKGKFARLAILEKLENEGYL